jgi:exodeoxyribonuclease VII small subunit
MSKVKSTKNFEDNYKKLQEIANKLKQGQQISVDQLLPLIKEATVAYEKCKSRLQAVNMAVNEHFKDLV